MLKMIRKNDSTQFLHHRDLTENDVVSQSRLVEGPTLTGSIMVLIREQQLPSASLMFLAIHHGQSVRSILLWD